MFEKEINEAVERFRTLLTEQLARQERMEHAMPAKNCTKAEKIVVGVCAARAVGGAERGDCLGQNGRA